jgi:hypothetical protein
MEFRRKFGLKRTDVAGGWIIIQQTLGLSNLEGEEMLVVWERS